MIWFMLSPATTLLKKSINSFCSVVTSLYVVFFWNARWCLRLILNSRNHMKASSLLRGVKWWQNCVTLHCSKSSLSRVRWDAWPGLSHIHGINSSPPPAHLHCTFLLQSCPWYVNPLVSGNLIRKIILSSVRRLGNNNCVVFINA